MHSNLPQIDMCYFQRSFPSLKGIPRNILEIPAILLIFRMQTLIFRVIVPQNGGLHGTKFSGPAGPM